MMSQVWSVSKYSHKSPARGRAQGDGREGGFSGRGERRRRGKERGMVRRGGDGRVAGREGTQSQGAASQPSQASAAAANESVTQCCLGQCRERVYLFTAPLSAL